MGSIPDADDLSAVTGEASEKTKTSKGVTAAGRYYWLILILGYWFRILYQKLGDIGWY